MKIVIAGGRGFIGQHLANHLKHHQLIILSRSPNQSHYWNPKKQEIAPNLMTNVDVVINLAGEPVVGRWTKRKLDLIRDSRFEATKFLTTLMEKNPPKLYIGASGMDYYGKRGTEILTEQSQSGHGYLAEVCRIWEQIPQKLSGIRQAYMRFGLVLGDGGALARMLPPFKLGLGGTLGDGSQIMSWITVDDVCRAIEFIITNEQVEGGVNFASPNRVTNHEFTKTLGKVLKRPTLMRVPAWVLRLFLGASSDLLLGSTALQPEVLLRSGFEFSSPGLESALSKSLILKQHRRRQKGQI